MATQTQTGGPTPQLFFQTANAYQQTEALKAAIELDLFTAIAEGKDTAQALAQRCAVAERGARILADYLTIQGFLIKEGNRYKLTPDSAVFLDRKSPAYMGSVMGFLQAPKFTEAFQNLTGAVRKGGTVAGDSGTVAPEHPLWVEFAKSMIPMMAKPAEEIAVLVSQSQPRVNKVLDIAAGHGLFGIAVLRANPNAKVTAVDWKNVLEVARENGEKFGVAERYNTLPGSIFDVDIGSGYDLVLIPNFLHHFDVETNEKLLRKLYAALVPGGRVATLEFVPNDDRVSPPMPATFALIMLADTPSGDAYTRAELESMMRNAGFTTNVFHPMPPSPHSVLISRRE